MAPLNSAVIRVVASFTVAVLLSESAKAFLDKLLVVDPEGMAESSQDLPAEGMDFQPTFILAGTKYII